MKKAILLVAIAVAWGTFSFADFPGSPIGGGGGSSLPDQTGNNGKVLTTDGSTASWGAAGSGTVTGPATATGDHFSSWGADNTTLKDSGYGAADFAPSSSTSTATDWNKWDGGATGLTAATGRTSLGLSSADNVTFSTVTVTEFVSSAADNTRGVTVPNTADPTGANLAAGKGWLNTTTNLLKFRNGDNSATLSYYPSGTMTDGKTCVYATGTPGTIVCDTTPTVYAAINRTKTFSFVIDNVVVATDNILLWRPPVAITITRADCYASTDNVVGQIMECATDNVLSCTTLDAWTVTNAASPFTDSSMTDGAVAAGAWIRWSTTSVGTTNSNKLSCTIQYNE